MLSSADITEALPMKDTDNNNLGTIRKLGQQSSNYLNLPQAQVSNYVQ